MIRTRVSFRKKAFIVGFAIYLTFILLSVIPYIAESHVRSRQEQMDDEYEYHLIFPTDGEYPTIGADWKYKVERVDPSKAGEITLKYTTASNTLNVETTNIKVLTIDCKNIYYDESMKVFKHNPSYNLDEDMNYYKNYFIELDLFTVNVKTDNKIDQLRFKFMPNPQNVFVNDVEWFEDSDYEYESSTIIFTNVPQGTTAVEVYFKPKIPPIAKFTMIGKDSQDTFVENKITYGILNKEIQFDASASSDDRDVVKYEWDFGDEATDSGKESSHTYSVPGKFTVNLTVTDDQDLKGYIGKSITIVEDKADLDADAMPDYWEGQYGLDPTTNDANNDSDGDGLTNLQEFDNGTRPNREDTDSDNYPDLEEIQKGSDPKDKNSIPKVGKADGDDELDLLTILMLVAVIIIILIIIMLLLLIKKRRKREEEDEISEGFGAVEEGESEEMESEMMPAPLPEQLEEPGTGAVPPSWGVEEGEEDERPFMPEGGDELPLYSGIEEDIAHEDLATDLEGLSISPEEGLPGVEEGLPPEEEKIPGAGLGLDEDLLDIGDEELLDEEKVGEEISEPKVKEPKKMKVKPPMPRKLKMDKKKIKLKKRQVKGKKMAIEEEEKHETEEKETEVKEEKKIEGEVEKEEPKKVEEEPEVPELTVKDYVKGGAIHFRNGKYTEAIIEWQKALDLEPDHPEIVASIKEAMAKLKEKQD